MKADRCGTNLDLADAHTGAHPPPPANPALPEDDGPEQVIEPLEPINLHLEKVDGSASDGKNERAGAKRSRAAVGPPGPAAIDVESPDEQGRGKEEGER